MINRAEVIRTMPARNGAGTERTLELTERDTEACRLRTRGYGWLAIAEKLGYSGPAHAHERVQTLMARIPVEAVGELRAMENERLLELRRSALEVLERRHLAISNGRLVYQAAGDDGREVPVEDDAPALKAMEIVIKISERIAKLNGLDSPQQLELTGTVNWTLVGVDPADLK